VTFCTIVQLPSNFERRIKTGRETRIVVAARFTCLAQDPDPCAQPVVLPIQSNSYCCASLAIYSEPTGNQEEKQKNGLASAELSPPVLCILPCWGRYPPPLKSPLNFSHCPRHTVLCFIPCWGVPPPSLLQLFALPKKICAVFALFASELS
jgi:hypothetical protein